MSGRFGQDDIIGFFTSLAREWEARFPDYEDQFAWAVREMALSPGETVLDLGCGTGRALPPIRKAVGSQGRVFGLDVTAGMLLEAQLLGRGRVASLVAADVGLLPFEDGFADAIFAGGLLPHLTDPDAALREMARVTRTHGKLVVFHAIGREALATHHKNAPSDNSILSPNRLRLALSKAGWAVDDIEDAAEHYFALALRK